MRALESKVRKSLLAWYDREKRDLPWRRTKDPYAVWVSEIMLQQTRVDTVIPYYERFMRAFPTPQRLSSASEDAVLSHWSGLGYYRRARLLHRGVKEVVSSYGGKLPGDAPGLRRLSGIGRYTAGAIASIAFDQPTPLVDGNVARVLARLFGIEEPVGSTEAERKFWAQAERLVEGERPGDFNQSLMELGAMVCTPKNPKCDTCPVRTNCLAHREDRVLSLPTPKARPKVKKESWVAVVATRGRAGAREIAFERRDKGLFRGLWSLPMGQGDDVTAARATLAAAGISARVKEAALGSVTHVLTHRRLSITLFEAGGVKVPSQTRLLKRSELQSELADLGVAKVTLKLLSLYDSQSDPKLR